MNATELFRLRLQSLVARGLAAGEIAARVRLAAASEVWGGGNPRERPAWYLWLRDAPGAWQLELAGAETLESAGRSAFVGRFTVRHYPSSAAAAFPRFSPEERKIAIEALDSTGTPRIELAATIPDALFTVASVEWGLDVESGATVFALASLDRLRTRSERGDVVRDVPGWRLGAPIFSLVAGLHAQVERRAAARLVVASQPGFERVLSGGAFDHRDTSDAVQAEALLLFSGAQASASGGDASRLLDALRDPAAETIADAWFVTGEHPPHEITPDSRLPLETSHSWFGGEEHVERPTCAC